MPKLFGDKRDIDQVIFDIAEHQRPRDHERLLQLLRDRELFSPIASSNVPIQDGAKIQVKEGEIFNLKLGQLPNGMNCALFFVHKDDPRLGEAFVGMTMPEALDMVLETNLEAMLIQNARESWVAFPRDKLLELRTKYS